ncbi:MAG: ATP synthase subunit I [Labilithrix sp.]|nr:ATP synthase subunit I [Labilithrix sp.]MCW5811186.1 ATP synthase subunit I [Labilithrix sp.]
MSDDTREPHPSDDVTRAAKVAAVLGVVFTVAALGLYDVRTAAGVFVGALIAVANLVTMRAIIRALVQTPESDDAKPAPSNDEHKSAGRRGGVAWGIFAVLKILVLFGGIWLLLSRQLVEPMPLVVGYGVLPLGIAASSLLNSLRVRR